MQDSLPDADVQAALERVLASPAFRNSRQCQKFLRYVVEHSHAGADEHLKERAIGIELFGRAPDYDTAEDPVVRVRATEVRKRLAQYYGDGGHADPVRLEIPSGSYRVEIHRIEPSEVPPRPSHRRAWTHLQVAAGILLLLLAGALAIWFASRGAPQGARERFWHPVLSSGRPVLLYCGQPVVYFLSRDVRNRFPAPPGASRSAAPVAIPPDATLRGSDIIPVTDQFVGIGNAHTAALLTGFFSGHHVPVEIRYANDLSFSDLRNSPAVLIGAFSNLWSLEMSDNLRFVFEQEGFVRRIRDKQNNRTWQLANQQPDGKTPEDFALVTRLVESASGHLIVIAAGITQYGTRAAGEFLTDEARLSEALRGQPAAWDRKNVQVLLQTTVYKGTPASPRIVVTHVW